MSNEDSSSLNRSFEMHYSNQENKNTWELALSSLTTTVLERHNT